MTTTHEPSSWLKQNRWTLFLLVIPFLLIPFLAGQLPDRVPIHWNIHGHPDDYASKWFALLFLPLLNVGMFLLLDRLPRFDSRRKASNLRLIPSINLGIILFMLGVWALIILSGMGYTLKMGKLVMSGVLILFAFIGNLMTKVRPNYFIGLRTPWTLESETVWRKSHRLMGHLWFFGSLALLPIYWVIPSPTDFFVFMGFVAVITFVPGIYSYVAYQREEEGEESAA